MVSDGMVFDATLVHVKGLRVVARVDEVSTDRSGELPVEVSVLQALTQGSKFDVVVEKAVELGACRIVPVGCARSSGEATPQRLERWRRIARAAAQQSRRRIVPIVDLPTSFEGALKAALQTSRVIVATETAAPGTLRQSLARAAPHGAIALAIGPEGSFSQEELELAKSLGCDFASLGPTILRTETAACAMLAAAANQLGWW